MTSAAAFKRCKFEALSHRFILATLVLPGGVMTTNKITVAGAKRTRRMFVTWINKLDKAISEAEGMTNGT